MVTGEHMCIKKYTNGLPYILRMRYIMELFDVLDCETYPQLVTVLNLCQVLHEMFC